MEKEDEMLTYPQVADLLSLQLQTVYSMVSRRRIPFIRLGKRVVRFSKRRIEAWLASATVEPNSEVG